MSFYDSYAYWNLDDEWFVSGGSSGGRTVAQFRRVKFAVGAAVASRYRNGQELETKEIIGSEQDWHRIHELA